MRRSKEEPFSNAQTRLDTFFRAKPPSKSKSIRPFLNKTSLHLILKNIRTPKHHKQKTMEAKNLLPKPKSQIITEERIQYDKVRQQRWLELRPKKKVRSKKD